MPYFNNPRTEEELKDQYRKILSKYDYRNPKNAELLSKVRKEYDETLMKIKRANGYRTPLEKVADSAKNYVKSEINDYKAAKAAEKERVDRLRNHKYTKEEFVKSYNQVKYYLGLIIEDLVKSGHCATIIVQRINHLDDIGLYQWFNAQDYIYCGNRELENKYNSAREVLEYSILSISTQTKTENEENLVKMEELLGKFFREYYRKCCDEFLDPIEVAKTEVVAHQIIKDNAISAIHSSILVTGMVLLIPLGFPLLVCVQEYHLPLILAIGIFIGIVVLIGNAIGKKINKVSKSTTYSTANSVEMARVTQKQKYQKDSGNRKAFAFFIRFILSLFRF